MTDTIFRTQTNDVSEVEKPMIAQESTQGGVIDIEVPYLDYSKTKNHSYLVDHYSLGDSWNDPEGGFSEEVGLIDSYIESKIRNGEMANTLDNVKQLIKSMEKTNNLTQEPRTVVKLEILANYAEFLMKNDKLKSNLRRYASGNA